MNKTAIYILITFILACHTVTGQTVDSLTFSIEPRISFYSSEKKGEILLNTSRGNTSGRLSVSIHLGSRIIGNMGRYS